METTPYNWNPESYDFVRRIAKFYKVNVTALIGNLELLSCLKQADFPEVDRYTFDDVISELKKPGRDPRAQAKILEFDSRLKSIADITVGMTLKGIVTNVTNFGAFINVGFEENGLIHKSNLANTYVEDPSQFIALHEHVEVQVIELDLQRKRIGLKKV